MRFSHLSWPVISFQFQFISRFFQIHNLVTLFCIINNPSCHVLLNYLWNSVLKYILFTKKIIQSGKFVKKWGNLIALCIKRLTALSGPALIRLLAARVGQWCCCLIVIAMQYIWNRSVTGEKLSQFLHPNSTLGKNIPSLKLQCGVLFCVGAYVEG